ncbi:MAG: hypothetical protein ACK5JS_05220 [Mangrovibacterium sp.]
MVYFGTMPAVKAAVTSGAVYQFLEGEFSAADIDFSACTKQTVQKGIHPDENARSISLPSE